MVRKITVLLIALCLVASSASAGDWPAFRGSTGLGVSDAQNVPIKWSSTENIAWKIPVPGDCNGSPIVSNGRVFVTSAEDKGRKRHLHCVDLSDGSQLWTRTTKYDHVMPTHKTNLYAGTTPASDGEHVIVWHSSAGLCCYNFQGDEVWKRTFGEFRHQWGYGTSPVLYEGKVILHSGPGQDVFIAALDVETGRTIWRTNEPVENDGDTNAAGKHMGSWSTPVIVHVDGRDQIVCSMSTRTIALDPTDGKLLWSCNGLSGDRGDLTYTSPIVAGDVCISLAGYTGPAVGFRMGGNGDITDKATLWRIPKKNPQRIGSGVVVDGFLYMANAGPNIIQCLKPDTGEVVWEQRSNAGAHWGSLVLADGKLYTTGQQGTTVVFKANPERYELVAVNRLEETSNSTPAIADGCVVIRTFDHLFCVRN
jgi:outer membrane protein assembly factor BamB